MNSGTRRALFRGLFVVWALWMLFLLWNRAEPLGYWLPGALIAVSLPAQAIAFIASRLERTDVSGAEMAARRLLFKPDPAARRGGTPL